MISRLSLDQLRIYVTVVRTGTFSAAARRLSRSQPAVSQAIHEVETTLGLKLFDRRAKAIVSTPAGEELVKDVEILLAQVNAIHEHAARLTGKLETELAIAVECSVPRVAVRDSLLTVSRAFPDLPIALFWESIGSAEELLREGLVQLACYSPRTSSGAADLAGERLGTMDVLPVVACAHPLAAAAAPISRQCLAQYTQLVMRDRRREVAPIRGSVAGSRFWSFTDMETRLDFLLAGAGWAHIPRHMLIDHLSEGRVIRLELDDSYGHFESLELAAFHSLGYPPGPAGRMLIKQLRGQLNT